MVKVDKIYLSTPTKIAILDHERKRTFVLRKDGLPDAGELARALWFISFSVLLVCIYACKLDHSEETKYFMARKGRAVFRFICYHHCNLSVFA